jgi:site-specific recombinase XerD
MSPEFILLQKGFTEWLQLLNYEPSTPLYMPKQLGEFFEYVQIKHHCKSITDIQAIHTENFFNNLEQRPNQRKPGGLSINYLRKYLQALHKFNKYITATEQGSIPIPIKLNGQSDFIKIILTPGEVQQLYEAINKLNQREPLLLMRDKVILDLYYGCGVRKSEGAAVQTTDVNIEKQLLFISKGKNYKERYVPVAEAVCKDIESYLCYSRPHLLKYTSNHLLLSERGKAITAGSIAARLQKMVALTNIEKPVGLHTLRHSIATHLLQSGMKLEQIAKFLGHSSLESTQIYTHLANQ